MPQTFAGFASPGKRQARSSNVVEKLDRACEHKNQIISKSVYAALASFPSRLF